MSKNRVVVLSLLYNNKLNMKHESRMAIMPNLTITDFKWQSDDTINKDEATLKYGENSNMHHSNSNINTDCLPMAKWQTTSYPTCNSLHEINTFSSFSTCFRILISTDVELLSNLALIGSILNLFIMLSKNKIYF